jgi:crotonobetainyl-CoA:carnitine CoA-transferase CaiB-like acyl-CoA transferase
MLADLGAEVIKVEPPMGDLTRFATPRINSQSSYFTQQNVGKKNISLNMTKPQAVEILKLLVARCDVVIENFRPGVMKKMGLDYEALHSSNPRLIYASISGYGATGPWVTRRAYAPVVNAETGITKFQGDVRGGQYANDPHSHGDVYTALEASAAVLAALYQREHTQCGQYIDVSMAETMLYVNEHAHNHLWDDDVPEGTIRSFQPADYPVLTVADGSMVVVSGHPAEKGTFDFFVGAMEKPELLSDARFKDIEHRLQHFSELMSIMLQWAKTVPTADEIEARLAKNQLACGRLRSVRELAETDWAESRGAIVNIDNRGTGTLRIPNSPWHFSGSDTSTRGVAQYRGEDNREVFSNIVGLDDETIATYERENILLSRGPTTR